MGAKAVAPAVDGIEVIFADASLLVLNKPPGLLTVPGRGADKQDCLSRCVQQHFVDALIVHRLDMATSGLVMMARGPVIQRILSRALAEHRVDKFYEAHVQGVLLAAPGNGWQTIDLPIGFEWAQRPRRCIDPRAGKSSVTRWRLMNPATPLTTPIGRSTSTHLELAPMTGRTHQLRVHLQALGHPIVGDSLYGNCADRCGGDDDAHPPRVSQHRLMLHARCLQLQHPLSGEYLQFDSPANFQAPSTVYY